MYHNIYIFFNLISKQEIDDKINNYILTFLLTFLLGGTLAFDDIKINSK